MSAVETTLIQAGQLIPKKREYLEGSTIDIPSTYYQILSKQRRMLLYFWVKYRWTRWLKNGHDKWRSRMTERWMQDQRPDWLVHYRQLWEEEQLGYIRCKLEKLWERAHYSQTLSMEKAGLSPETKERKLRRKKYLFERYHRKVFERNLESEWLAYRFGELETVLNDHLEYYLQKELANVMVTRYARYLIKCIGALAMPTSVEMEPATM